MKKDAENRIAAQLAKAVAMVCVRNSFLEDLHTGTGRPVAPPKFLRFAGN